MSGRWHTVRSAATVILAMLAVEAVSGRVDVKVEYDKAFDFKAARTWGWTAEGPGQVIMARTPDDDPEAARKRIEPIITSALVGELARVGLTSGAANPDLFVAYYLLLSNTMSSQTLGQFIPGTVAWGLPPFPLATQSLEVMNRGSLVLDLSAGGKVVWRGVAQANFRMDLEERRRRELVAEAVRDLVRRYPKG
jgi:hypothetical protein